MIVVENHIPVKSEFREQFEKMFAAGAGHVKNSPGFIRNEVLRPLQAKDYIIMTHWESLEDFERWKKSEEFAKAHAHAGDSSDMFEGDSYVTVHEVSFSTQK